MKAYGFNFDLFAMTKPKSRADIAALALEIIAEMDIIDGHIDALMKNAAPEVAA